MSSNKEQGIALYSVKKFDLSEVAFRKALVEDPNDPGTHAMLANALIAQKKYDKGAMEARLAIKCAPDLAIGYFVLSTALANLGNHAGGEEAVKQALRIEPDQPTYLARASFFAAFRGSWPEALKYAEQGLARNPDDIDCINRRAAALVRLGRHADCEQSLQRALELEPDNSYTHANVGWTLVLRGRSADAVDHFKESLRLDPNSKWAYEGVLEAMKSRNPLYKFLLSISLGFKERSVLGRVWLFVMCLINPWLWIVLYLLLVWELFIRTLFTALLRLDPFGRLVLTDEAKRQNNGYIALTISLGIGPVILITGVISALIATSEPDKKSDSAKPASSITRRAYRDTPASTASSPETPTESSTEEKP